MFINFKFLVLALYSKTHPDYPAYLYLMAPISLAILNPIAFVLMELGKRQELTATEVKPKRSESEEVAESNLQTPTTISSAGKWIVAFLCFRHFI